MPDPIAPAAPAAPVQQLPPSSFDAAMSQMNNAPPPAAPAPVEKPTQFNSKIAPPPLANAELVHDGNDPDPNDPAEIQARAELQRLADGGLAKQKPPQQQEEDDSIQAQVLGADQQKFYEQWKSWNESVNLPEEFNTKLVSVPWDREKGTMRDVPVAEMKEGYLRVIDYTRKTQAAARVHQEAQAHINNMNMFLADLGNGNMRTRLEDLGYGKQLRKVAEEIYQETLAEERLLYDMEKKGATKEQLAYLRQTFERDREHALQLRASNRQNEQHQARERERAAASQQNEEGAQLKHQLDQLRPAAFRALGVPDDAIHQNAFHEVFMSLLNTGAGKGKTLKDVVVMATQGAKQLVEEHISNAQALAVEEARKAAAQATPLPPQRLPGPPPRTHGVQQSGHRRLGLNDFDSEMARLDGRA